jgi:hypothetical protein
MRFYKIKKINMNMNATEREKKRRATTPEERDKHL